MKRQLVNAKQVMLTSFWGSHTSHGVMECEGNNSYYQKLPCPNCILYCSSISKQRFTTEFENGGEIDTATPEEKNQAWIPPKNDVDEGALGALQSYL
jgi:hypothetical protein